MAKYAAKKKFARSAAVTVTTGAFLATMGQMPAMAETPELAQPLAEINLPVLESPQVVPAAVVPVVTGDMVVAAARKHIGANYVWGGESDAEGGYDCSGLVFRAYADLGINVPRTSGELAGFGTAVGSLAQAQPGDILTWPGHVAIYSGNGNMIEAAEPGTLVHERGIWGSPGVRRILTGVQAAPAAPVAPKVAPVVPPVKPAPAPVQKAGNKVVVKSGDCLSTIALTVGEDWHKLYEENKTIIGDNPNLIVPGQVFFVGGLPVVKAPVTVQEQVAPKVEALAFITNSAGPVKPDTQAAANAVFSDVRGASLITIGGTRASAIDPNGHPSGRALDYMVLSDAHLGDAIVSYHVQHWAELHVEYIIWEQRILTSPGGTWQPMEDRGSITANHRDHVHVNYN